MCVFEFEFQLTEKGKKPEIKTETRIVMRMAIHLVSWSLLLLLLQNGFRLFVLFVVCGFKLIVCTFPFNLLLMLVVVRLSSLACWLIIDDVDCLE